MCRVGGYPCIAADVGILCCDEATSALPVEDEANQSGRTHCAVFCLTIIDRSQHLLEPLFGGSVSWELAR